MAQLTHDLQSLPANSAQHGISTKYLADFGGLFNPALQTLHFFHLCGASSYSCNYSLHLPPSQAAPGAMLVLAVHSFEQVTAKVPFSISEWRGRRGA